MDEYLEQQSLGQQQGQGGANPLPPPDPNKSLAGVPQTQNNSLSSYTPEQVKPQALDIAPPSTKIQSGKGSDQAPPSPGDDAPAPGTVISLSPDTPENATPGKVSWSDYAKTTWDSAKDLGAQALGAAQFAATQLHADPSTVSYIEGARKSLQASIQSDVESMSPDMQHAIHASIFGGQDENGNPIPKPGEIGWGRYLAVNAAQMLPSAALAVVPELTLGKVGLALTGVAFGTTTAGEAYNQLVDDMEKLTPKDYANNPAWQAAQAKGVAFDDFKKQALQTASRPMMALDFAMGAAMGANVGSTVTKGVFGTTGKSLMTRLGLSVGENAAVMGGVAGGVDATQQYANQSAGVQAGFDTSELARNFASGALQGAGVGVIGGLFHGGRQDISPTTRDPNAPEETKTPGPSTGAVMSPDLEAALDTQLSFASSFAPPGINPGEEQGSLFRSIGEANAQSNVDRGATATSSGSGGSSGGPGPGGTSVRPGGAPTDLGTAGATAAPKGPRPSDGMKVGDLRDALKTMPDTDPRTLARMGKNDLATMYDQKVGTTGGKQAPVAAVEAGAGAEANAPTPTAPTPAPAAPITSTQVQARDGVGHNEAVTRAAAENAAAPTTVGETPAPSPQADLEAKAHAAEQPKSPEQAEAGNYQKGHVNVGGLDVSVETPRGELRTGVGADGRVWQAKSPDHYGYIRGTKAADGEHLDVMLGPQAHEPEAHQVYVFDQKDPKTGLFDEHKAYIGYDNPLAAMHAYDASFSDGSGPTRRGAANAMSFDEFKEWTKNGDTTKAISYKPTVSDSLRAKRVAQKARMADTGPRVRGEVATVELPKSEATPEPPTRTKDEAVSQSIEAIRKTIIPLKKGGDITRVINTIGKQLDEAFGKAKTDQDVAEGVAKWAREKPGEVFPGTRTRRLEVGDAIVKLLTNKTVDEFSGRASRVSAEARLESRRPSVMETEGTAREAAREEAHAKDVDRETVDTERPGNDLTNVSEEEAPGAQTQTIEGAAQPEPQKLSDKLPYWLDMVRQGQMTPAEAEAKYGGEGRTTGGRGRMYKSFGDYLDKEIARAEDPATREGLLAKIAAKDKLPTSQARSAATVKLNAELEHTGKEYADSLRKMRAELDPVKAVAETTTSAKPETAADKLRARAAERAAGKTTRVTNVEEGKTLIQRLKDIAPKVDAWAKANGFDGTFGTKDIMGRDVSRIEKLIEEHAAGSSAQLDRSMDRMSSFKADRYDWSDKVPEMHKWVNDAHAWLEKLEETNEKALKQPTPKGRVVQTAAHDPEVNKTTMDLLKSGTHDLKEHLAAIAADPAVAAKTPELASLARRLQGLIKDGIQVDHSSMERLAGEYSPGFEPGTGSIRVNPSLSLSPVETLLHEAMHSVTAHYIENLPAGHPDRMALDAMHTELERLARNNTLSPDDLKEVQYAMSNAHELHTMLMTNPALQQLAASARPSFGFQNSMRRLGYGLDAVKSVWAGFSALVRRALGMRGIPTPDNASLMDHLLKPITDITDRAAAFNHADENTQTKMITPSEQGRIAQDVVKAAKGAVDPATLGDKLMRHALQMTNLDHIVTWNRARFQDGPRNSLEDYRSASEKIQARAKQFNDDYVSKVNDLVQSYKGPERDKLASLMVDASTSNVRLGKNVDNSHLTTVAELARQKELQTRYDALAPATRAAYDASHKLLDAMHDEEHEAQLSAMLKGVMPDASPEELSAMKDVAHSSRETKAFLADPDNHDLASKFGSEWKNQRKLVKGILEMHDYGRVQGDYFPLRHDGDYIVHYGDKLDPKTYGVEAFDTIGAAQARHDELAKQGTDGLSGVLSKRENRLSDIVSMPAMDEITAQMKRNGMDDGHVENMRQIMASVVLQHASRSAAALARIRRQGVLGASKDIEKVVGRHVQGIASRIGYAEHGVDRLQAVQAMQDHTDLVGREGNGSRQRAMQAVTKELQSRVAVAKDNDSLVGSALRAASPLGYIQSLMSPSHMLTSTFEAHSNSLPIMGGRHGFARASLALGKALRDTVPVMVGKGASNVVKAMSAGLRAADWNLSTVVRDRLVQNGADAGHMGKLFTALNASGLIDHSYARELQAIAKPGGVYTSKLGGWWHKFLDLNAAMAHASDVANKSAIAKAAFDLEMKKTGSVDGAVRYAVDTARNSMPNYNAANKARITTSQGSLGQMAPVMTQFKMYGIHQYGMMANLVHTWTHGATPEMRREARNAFVGVLATHTATAGLIGGTFLGDGLRFGGGLYDWATGATQPHDYENDVRKLMAENMGTEFAEVLARGVPHLANIDIHRRVGLSNLLEPPELKSFDAKGVKDMLATSLVGASGEDAATMAGGVGKLLTGDIAGGIKDMVPRIVRDPMKAAILADKGLTTGAGKVIVPPDKITTSDVIAQALGFQPAQMSEAREAHFAISEAKQDFSQAHSRLLKSYVQAAPEDKEDAMDDIQTFNRAHPGNPITVQQLLQARQRAKTTAKNANTPGAFGLTLGKKGRGALEAAGDFADTD